jgi:hypothetical protein
MNQELKSPCIIVIEVRDYETGDEIASYGYTAQAGDVPATRYDEDTAIAKAEELSITSLNTDDEDG